MIAAEPKPTQRFVLDPIRICNLKCKFCYHIHTYDSWNECTLTLQECKNSIDEGEARGNTRMDITGGEPTMHPDIETIVAYAVSKGLKVCIITNGLASYKKLLCLQNAGISEFLVSRHGLQKTHNKLVGNDKAYDRQVSFLEYVKSITTASLRFNCVINKHNQKELVRVAEELIKYKPKIVNFINMNPHHIWTDKKEETKKVICDLDVVRGILPTAISCLEGAGIGVNVRYFPYCGLPKEYWRCICNDFHVMFDPYEWDYNTMPKTFESYKNWGVETSLQNEEKGRPCCFCTIRQMCGGANKFWHAASNEVYGEKLISKLYENVDLDFYYHRKLNFKTLFCD